MASEAKIAEAFNAFDPTGTGKLTWKDFQDAARSLGLPFTDAQLSQFKKSAPDGVTLANFKMWYVQLAANTPASNVDADLKAAFEVLDADKTGKVSKKMVRHYFSSVGEKMSDAELDEMLKGAPESLDFAAFKKAITGQ